jgi:hypothetical protein
MRSNKTNCSNQIFIDNVQWVVDLYIGECPSAKCLRYFAKDHLSCVGDEFETHVIT